MFKRKPSKKPKTKEEYYKYYSSDEEYSNFNPALKRFILCTLTVIIIAFVVAWFLSH